MKNWFNRFLGKQPENANKKVQVDLRYQTHKFSIEDFQAGNERLAAMQENHAHDESDISSNEINNK